MSPSCFNIDISNRINNYEECLEPTATTASQPVMTSPIADYSTTAFEEYEGKPYPSLIDRGICSILRKGRDGGGGGVVGACCGRGEGPGKVIRDGAGGYQL